MKKGFTFFAVVGAAIALLCPVPSDAGPALGVFVASGCTKGCKAVESVKKFEQWSGGRVTWVVDYVGGHSWDQLVQTAADKAAYWSSVRPRYRLSLAIQMLPGSGTQTLQDGADGKYEYQFKRIAKALVANGEADADLRIGWEFNGGWYAWHASQNPAAFAKFWRHCVKAMRSVKGQNFTFDWNVSLGTGTVALKDLYPGDDFVDIIGIDFYNDGWSYETPQARWQKYLSGPYGLDSLAAFAKEHHKPLAFPEWGTGTKSHGLRGSDDDAYFVRSFAKWLRGHDVLYAAYFDRDSASYQYHISGGKMPGAAEAYQQDIAPLARSGPR